MTIENDIAQVRKNLDMISQYNYMVLNNNFEPNTIADMKGNAKDICNATKSKIDTIKSEINNWG